MRNAYKILVAKSERKRPLERPRRKREDDMRIDLSGIEWESADWIHLGQDRYQWGAVVDAVMNLRVT
jgi:hypothetical protein